MRRISPKNEQKAGAGKLITGVLVGGVVGATVGWLTTPDSGEKIRRRFRGDTLSAREKAKTVEENLESRTRELVQEVSDTVETG